MGYRLKENPNGNVSKQVFIKKLKELSLMFPTWKMDLSNQETVKLLYKHLGYCKDDVFEKGVDSYIRTEFKNPTVATLKVKINSRNEKIPTVINTVDNEGNLLFIRHKFNSAIELIEYPNDVKTVKYKKGRDFLEADLSEIDFIEEVTDLATR